ncbi:hypothetical protein HOLleu_27975 [Holothuria leucospilota]|uniref:Uncharacterized protein n=1 Tax=Holothuria leucospilota TaxID=206669 RepID=A0A9Q1H3M2_HOLLE|nr:hypothetical protein HOLleu_27975 [Holothuria leucospilota]
MLSNKGLLCRHQNCLNRHQNHNRQKSQPPRDPGGAPVRPRQFINLHRRGRKRRHLRRRRPKKRLARNDPWTEGNRYYAL